jgi:hypothetical protein
MKSSGWALLLTGAALALFWEGCAVEPGELPPDMRIPVNQADIDAGVCVKTCEPDFGSGPVDCAAAEEGLEFFPGAPAGSALARASTPVWDFNGAVATDLYSYTDKTTNTLVTTGDPTCLTQSFHAPNGCDPNGYQPVPSPIERCGKPDRALHVRGGPFFEWGGGVGRRLDDFANEAARALSEANPAAGLASSCVLPDFTPADACAASMPSAMPSVETCKTLAPINPPPDNQPAFCPESETCIDCAAGVPFTPTDANPDPGVNPMNATAYYTAEVDLREWEGISFWARRGPDGQRTLRVALGDRNTDDDISFLMTQGGAAPRCVRAKECGCKDQERPCTENPELPGEYWCWNPATDPPLSEYGSDPTLLNLQRCGTSLCDEPYPAYPSSPDLSFSTPSNSQPIYRGTNSCAYYTFPNDTNGRYCYDTKKGPNPAEGGDRCGDPWIYPVVLNPDWTLYTIPFTDLHQDGYAKEFGALELAAVTMVRFLWPQGFIDFWVDDVRFYRRKP